MVFQPVLYITVFLEQFHSDITRRELRRQLSGFLQGSGDRPQALFDNRPLVDMNVTHTVVLVLIDGDHRVQQGFDAPSMTGDDRHHRHSHHPSQTVVVEFGAACFQLVVHVERDDHARVQVDEFGSEVEVAFQIRSHDGVDNYVRRMFRQVAAYVKLFGRISGECVGARQVGDFEAVAFVVIVPPLGVHRDAAVIADVFVASRNSVEQRGLAAVRVAHQCDVDPF